MKLSFFIILFFTPFLLYTQSYVLSDTCCDNKGIKMIDRVEGNSYYATIGDVNISGHSFSIITVKNVLSITFNVDQGCIDAGGDFAILFVDGTRLKGKSKNSFNCKGEITLLFGGQFGNLDLLQQLKTKPIDILRFNYGAYSGSSVTSISQYSLDLEFDDYTAEWLPKTLAHFVTKAGVK